MNTYHSLLWYRSGFNTDIKVDHINNHLAGSFNSWIREIKDLPIHELMDSLRIMIVSLFNKRRTLSNMLYGDKLSSIVQQQVCRSRKLGHFHVDNASVYNSEVLDTRNGRRHVVTLDQHECTCLEWQATGKPCPHAIVVLAGKTHLMLGEYLHEYYSVERFKAAYAGVVPPLTNQSQWPEVELGYELCAPGITRKSGRPKHKRFKSFLERRGKKGTKGQMKGGKGKGKDADLEDLDPLAVTRGKGSKNKQRCARCHLLGHRANSQHCVFSLPRLPRVCGKKKKEAEAAKEEVEAREEPAEVHVVAEGSSEEWTGGESSSRMRCRWPVHVLKSGLKLKMVFLMLLLLKK